MGSTPTTSIGGKCVKKIRITIDKEGNLRAWNGPEFEKLKGKLGKEDDRRRVLHGRTDLCG